jgi:hypothetical protein
MGKKGSNPPPPPGVVLVKRRERYAAVFNEWAKRASDERSKEDFSSALNENGRLKPEYGEDCAAYFMELEQEMMVKGLIS